MDYVTRQFIQLTKKLRAELRKSLFDLRNALQKQTEAIRESSQAANTKNSVPPEITTVVHLPESIKITKDEPDATKDEGYQRAAIWVSSLTLIAIVGYAVIVWLQYREMINATGVSQSAVNEARHNRLQSEKAFSATIEQSHLEQRAWVGVVSVDSPDLKPKPDFFVNLHVINSGHTPALDFRSDTVLHSLTKEEPFSPVYGPRAPGDIPSHGVIQPNEVIMIQTNRFPITQGQIEWVKNGKYILYVYGRMSYDDVFHTKHHTTFCKEVLSETLVKDCGTYNTAD